MVIESGFVVFTSGPKIIKISINTEEAKALQALISYPKQAKMRGKDLEVIIKPIRKNIKRN